MAAADICHAAAMPAGVSLGPAVLNAMSVALATGSGLSALVSVYIC